MTNSACILHLDHIQCCYHMEARKHMSHNVMVSEYIKALNAKNSRIYKEDSLRKFCKGEPTLIAILERTYNPRWVYNVRKISPKTFGEKTILEVWDEMNFLLNVLHDRVLTGDAARDACVDMAEKLLPEEAEVFQNILKGDLRCGINAATINKVIPDLIPETPYMRCSIRKGSNFGNWDWTQGIISQVKADGMYVNVILDELGEVSILSRNGSEFANETMKDFVSCVQKNLEPGKVYMGEMLVLEDGEVMSREEGNGAMNSVLKGGNFKTNQKPLMVVWDVVSLVEWTDGICHKPYINRWDDVTKIHGEYLDVIETKVVTTKEQALAHYQQVVEQGGEGTVVKHPHTIWKNGTSKDQVKMKIEAEVDLKVVGMNPGNGKHAGTFGSLVCESADGKLQVSVSGFTDKMRQSIFENREEWLNGKIVTVRANSIMYNEAGPNRLFLPRFVEERLDKTVADSFEKVEEIFASAF